MGRLILHLGGHKTGSSAVQLWLTQNAEALLKAGIVFPTKFVGKAGNASKLARALVLTPERNGEIPVQLRADFLAFCKENSDHDVFVSAERFETDLLPRIPPALADLGDTSDVPAPTAALLAELAERLETVKAFALDAGFSGVTMVYLIRNIVDATSSGFAQRVKAIIHDAFDDPAFYPASGRYRDHATYNRMMEDLGFTVAMDALDPSAVSVVDQVMRLAGLSDRISAVADVATPRANESIGQLGVLAGMHLARVLAQGPQDNALRRQRALSHALKQSCLNINDASFNGFLPEDAAIVARRQAALNEALAPWMGPDRIAMVAEPRRSSPRSPLSIKDLDEVQAQTVRDILDRVADLMSRGRNASLGYSREEIIAIGTLPPVPKPARQARRKGIGPRRKDRIGTVGASSQTDQSLAQPKRKKLRRSEPQVADAEGGGYPKSG